MQLIAHNTNRDRMNTLPRVASSEYLIAGSALLLLLAAQWILSSVILATNYYGGDGKMVVSTVLTASNSADISTSPISVPCRARERNYCRKTHGLILRFGRLLFSPTKRLPTFQP